jgi:DNA-binding protein HU-beta
MKTVKASTDPELDRETDHLLDRIARSGDRVDPSLLRAIIPSREVYMQYLKRHKLTKYPIAQEILAQFDALEANDQVSSPKPRRVLAGSRVAAATLTKTALIQKFAQDLEITKKQSAAFLELLAETAIKETKKNGVFVLPGLGRLVKAERKLRLGRNPQTGEQIKIRAKTVVKFRVAKNAKDAISGTRKK